MRILPHRGRDQTVGSTLHLPQASILSHGPLGDMAMDHGCYPKNNFPRRTREILTLIFLWPLFPPPPGLCLSGASEVSLGAPQLQYRRRSFLSLAAASICHRGMLSAIPPSDFFNFTQISRRIVIPVEKTPRKKPPRPTSISYDTYPNVDAKYEGQDVDCSFFWFNLGYEDQPHRPSALPFAFLPDVPSGLTLQGGHVVLTIIQPSLEPWIREEDMCLCSNAIGETPSWAAPDRANPESTLSPIASRCIHPVQRVLQQSSMSLCTSTSRI